MIREALDRMALGERAVLAGVEVERCSLFGFRVGAEVLTGFQVALLLHFALHRPRAVKVATKEQIRQGLMREFMAGNGDEEQSREMVKRIEAGTLVLPWLHTDAAHALVLELKSAT